MQALYCLIYLVATGMVVFICGRLFPRKWIFENYFPFNSFAWEKQGAVYEKIGIRKWKTKWPDGSMIYHKIFGKIMGKFYPKKRIDERSSAKLAVLVKESCVAESTHFVSILLGVGCWRIWRGLGGVAIWLLWTLWNIPPILIQRYNRPRLKRALQMSTK